MLSTRPRVTALYHYFHPDDVVSAQHFAGFCKGLVDRGWSAEGMLSEHSLIVRLVKRMLRRAYGSCDLVADLGSCMRARLESYGHVCRKVTLVPWALSEPAEIAPAEAKTRRELFGHAGLTIL